MPNVARIGDRISHGGVITSGSGDVKANGIGVARIGDKVRCRRHKTQVIVSGSSSVKANGRGVARIGDRVSCGARIVSGSGDVKAG